MANFFRNSVVNGVGTTRTNVLETAINSRMTVIGFSLANLTDGVILASVELQDETSTVGYYAKELIIPPNTSLRVLNGGEKLILTPNNIIYVTSNVDNSIDVILSYVEII
jgi:hypothetical protein